MLKHLPAQAPVLKLQGPQVLKFASQGHPKLLIYDRGVRVRTDTELVSRVLSALCSISIRTARSRVSASNLLGTNIGSNLPCSNGSSDRTREIQVFETAIAATLASIAYSATRVHKPGTRPRKVTALYFSHGACLSHGKALERQMTSTHVPEAFIFDAIRTPRGKGKLTGSLHTVKSIDLVVGLIEEICRRVPDLDEDRISDIILGIVTQVGEHGMDLARIAALAAKMPYTVAGIQIKRFCASGLSAGNMAAAKIRSGSDEMVFAGGVESMSRVPMGTDGGAWATNPVTNYETYFSPQDVGADLIATIERFDRERVDAYAVRSQHYAKRAWDEGRFDRSVVPVRDMNGLMLLDNDEHMRPEASVNSPSDLRPSFKDAGKLGGFDAVALQKYHWVDQINHFHHAGNSSGIVDGAALAVVGTEKSGAGMGKEPRARVVAQATSGVDTTIMLTGLTPAAEKALALAGLAPEDIDIWEINEAFASVVLRFQKDMNIADEKLNPNGGAIAMGYPLGAAGAVILGSTVNQLHRSGGKRALVPLCVGGGMGVATIIERV